MNNTTLVALQIDEHDSVGACIYIVVVLLWYSMSTGLLMAIEMFVPDERVEDSINDAKKRAHNSERENHRRILEELADKEKRARLWEIYLRDTETINTNIANRETIHIRHIEQRLATFDRHKINDMNNNISSAGVSREDSLFTLNFTSLSLPKSSSNKIRRITC